MSNLNVLIVVATMGTLLSLASTKELDVNKEKIEIELKVMTGAEVLSCMTGDSTVSNKDSIEKKLYVWGIIRNHNSKNAKIVFDLHSNSYHQKRKIEAGWLPANNSAPTFFLVYIGEHVEQTGLEVNALKFDYEIKRIFLK